MKLDDAHRTRQRLAALRTVAALLEANGAVAANRAGSPAAGPLYFVWPVDPDIDAPGAQIEVCCTQRIDPTNPFSAKARELPRAWKAALAARWPLQEATNAGGWPCVWVTVDAL